MAEVKQIAITPEIAERLGALTPDAERRDMLRHSNSLEYALVRTRNALAVIARSLGDFADGYATEDDRRRGLSEDDVATLYGTASLLECVAAECERAYRGEGAA